MKRNQHKDESKTNIGAKRFSKTTKNLTYGKMKSNVCGNYETE